MKCMWGMIVLLMTSNVAAVGPELTRALKESKFEKSSAYIDRLQKIASWLFFEAKYLEATNNNKEYSTELGYAADALAFYISSPVIEEIEEELEKLPKSMEKLELVKMYYTDVCRKLEAKSALNGPFKVFSPL